LQNAFSNDLRGTDLTFHESLTGTYIKDPAFPQGQNPVYAQFPTATRVSQPFGRVFTDYWEQFNNNFRQQIGFQLSIPLFNGNSVRTNYEKAKLNVKTANLNKQSDLLLLKQAIYDAYFNAVASLEKFEANKKAVTTAERSFDLASKRYNIGLLNSIDYLTNQNNMFTARINRLLSQYDYVFRMKVLEYYKGLGVKL